MTRFTESTVEEATLEYFESLGYAYVPGPELAPGAERPERETLADVVLVRRLRAAIERLNPAAPPAAVEEALRIVLRRDAPSLVANNRAFHQQLTEGVTVEVAAKGGEVKHPTLRLVDFEDPDQNDFLVVNQFTVHEAKQAQRPDVVVFVNGLPLAVIELKNAFDEDADTDTAVRQLQTYKRKDRIEGLFVYNGVLVAADGVTARIGSLTAGRERFMPWRTIEGEREAPKTSGELEVLIRGVFNRYRFLEYLRSFVVFESDKDAIIKKIAGYHQFHAVQVAVQETLRATSEDGSRKVGVVWHTQGSGKSLTMAFYAGRVIRQAAMENPTIVVITDRNDLDDQLFGTFAACKDLIRQTPKQVDSRDDLKEKLSVGSGGVIFTTIQKFLPETRGGRLDPLSHRRNIIVMADEAHRSQYGLDGKLKERKGEDAYVAYGFAKHLRDALPNASYIAFTGTPVELEDRNTRDVFGEYISVYDIQQAVEDGATVPIYFESRVAKLQLDETRKPKLDEEFEEVTEGEEESDQERLKTKWAALEALVGSEDRIRQVAQDLVTHFERRNDAMPGKAMIVCMSRRICVQMYDALVALRPDWHHEDDDKGQLKVVMTGAASDKKELQPHIRNKARRKSLAGRFKDDKDPFRLVIVRDMWLTGFDAPCMHTLYVDKPMHGHGLMQAIARVNRVFRDKPGGLVVDYLGIADSLRHAMGTYTRSGGRGRTTEDAAAEALPILLEQVEICRDMFHGFDYQPFFTGKASRRVAILPAAQEHILAQENGKDRFVQAVAKLTKANALAGTLDEAAELKDEIAFFQGIKACLVKSTRATKKSRDEVDNAVRQIVSSAIISDEVIDVFSAAGLQRPDISILSDEFMEEVRQLPHKNVAAELLRKLLEDEIKTHARTNLVKSRAFSEMLAESLSRYHKRGIETIEVIEELIDLAKRVRQDAERGKSLGLNQAEIAFYDALADNNSARDLMKDEVLRKLATELTTLIRKNVTIDWTVRENVRANLRRLVKRLLRKYKYPPDLQEGATLLVLRQAELLADELTA